MLLRGLAVAGLLAVLQWGGAHPAAAADLYSPYYNVPRAEAPDEDPRYGDVYRLPPQRYVEPRYTAPYEPPPRYVERQDGPYYPPRVYAERGEYLPPMRGPTYHDLSARDEGCVSRREIRRSLREDGWSEFDDLDLRGDIALLRASRPNGEVYELKVDRCTGRVLRAKAVEDGPGPYAWRRRESFPAY